MSHTHINAEDLSCLSRMLRSGYSFKDIACTLGKDPSTVSKHVNSNGGRNNYDVKEVKRKKRIKRILAVKDRRKIKGVLLTQITKELKHHKTPEQIAGKLNKRHGKVIISTNTIYRYIKERAPHLKQYLTQAKRVTKRRRGTNIRAEHRYILTKKKRIDERPSIVERRGRFGDFEGDTIIGSDKRVRIVTLVDRRSGYLIAFLLPKCNSELLSLMIINRLKYIPLKKRKTITFDNGVEFSDWERIEEKSKVKIYFCYPYHSWERGTNENTNGLIRRYYPKGYDFNLITDQELKDVVTAINNRERKRLQYKSPKQVFWGFS